MTFQTQKYGEFGQEMHAYAQNSPLKAMPCKTLKKRITYGLQATGLI
jgi:hypothetical protein